jgi:dTDP-4-dehydrorhamnose 3,5-epimerase
MAERLPTELDGVVLIEPRVHGDERGFLVETWRRDTWAELGVDLDFVQHNHSRSARGTLRGLHFQTSPGQAKLVRCMRGRIFDVAVDLRRDSPTFGRWEGHQLDDERHRQLLVPIGFAHGFCVISDVADVSYQLSSVYDPATEAGIAWDDPDVGVEWPVADPLLSERDRAAPRLSEVADSLSFGWPVPLTAVIARLMASFAAIPV